MNILLFSRPVHSGKTTELLDRSAGQPGVFGIAMPDEHGVRQMRDVRTGVSWLAQCLVPGMAGQAVETIGRFAFYQSSFQRANDLLRNAASARPRWIVIDEIGTLEMSGGGFRPVLDEILQVGSCQNLLLVVRDTLLDTICQVCGHWPCLVAERLDGDLFV
ncbi:MAG: NTPase [Flaviaesturariibacter sp.]|nr:NTPase [Flaviaesturariibacter sp.]